MEEVRGFVNLKKKKKAKEKKKSNGLGFQEIGPLIENLMGFLFETYPKSWWTHLAHVKSTQVSKSFSFFPFHQDPSNNMQPDDGKKSIMFQLNTTSFGCSGWEIEYEIVILEINFYPWDKGRTTFKGVGAIALQNFLKFLYNICNY